MTKIFFVHERPNPTDQSNPLVVPPVNREFDLSYVILIIPGELLYKKNSS